MLPAKKHLSIDISLIKQMMDRDEVNFITCITTDKKLADRLIMHGASVKVLIDGIENGHFNKIF